MARPKAKELTERELEVMQAFWDRGESTTAEVRDALAEMGEIWLIQRSRRWCEYCSKKSS